MTEEVAKVAQRRSWTSEVDAHGYSSCRVRTLLGEAETVLRDRGGVNNKKQRIRA